MYTEGFEGLGEADKEPAVRMFRPEQETIQKSFTVKMNSLKKST